MMDSCVTDRTELKCSFIARSHRTIYLNIHWTGHEGSQRRGHKKEQRLRQYMHEVIREEKNIPGSTAETKGQDKVSKTKYKT